MWQLFLYTRQHQNKSHTTYNIHINQPLSKGLIAIPPAATPAAVSGASTFPNAEESMPPRPHLRPTVHRNAIPAGVCHSVIELQPPSTPTPTPANIMTSSLCPSLTQGGQDPRHR